jgi:plastocyanin
MLLLSAGSVAAVRGQRQTAAAPRASGTGAIKGRIRLAGPPPGNVVIRMGLDPKCAAANAGKKVTQDLVLAGADGSLANVFVAIDGAVKSAPPAPAEAVTIDQRGCVYTPRVIGARTGQTLEVRNSDNLLHNVHSLSGGGNAFNVGQPLSGMVYTFQLRDEEVMLRIKCDVHRWMTSYVGVVSHPYFAVSAADGTFSIANVPPGDYTLRAWHERYGDLRLRAQVKPGQTTVADFSYSGSEKAPLAGIVEMTIRS